METNEKLVTVNHLSKAVTKFKKYTVEKAQEAESAAKKGTASAEKVLSGYTFTSEAAGVEVQGTMPDQGAKTGSLNCGGSYTIPEGYHNGSGKVTANSLASQTPGDATASDIAKDKTAWVNGAQITGTSEGGSGGTADLPTHLSSLSANPGNGFVTLTLEYSSTDCISGVLVVWKTGGYPTSPTDGQSMTVSGAATSIKVTGLTNTVTYYFRIFLYNEIGGVKYYQTDITNARVTGTPGSVEILGITPYVSGTDYAVIVESCSFTMSAPAGTRIVIGGGGRKGADGSSSGQKEALGGYVQEILLPDTIENAECSVTIGKAVSTTSGTRTTSSLKIGETTYDSGSDDTPITTKWGPVGGHGGGGGVALYNSSVVYPTDPTGAGGGGGGARASYSDGEEDYDDLNRACLSTAGGNYLNADTQNFGGSGGEYGLESSRAGKAGAGGSGGSGNASSSSGYSTRSYGGGGGGFSAGGGQGGYGKASSNTAAGTGGAGGSGIIVIEWSV